MKNYYNGTTNKWVAEDASENIYSFEETTQVGNAYQDLMGFGELWVITKIENSQIYLVSVSNQWRPEIVTPYEADFLYRFARYNFVKKIQSDIISKGE